MAGLPAGKCRDCGAPASYFARLCPNCHAATLPNPVATVTGLLGVALAVGLIAFGWRAFRSAPPTPPTEAAQPASATTAPSESAATSSEDYGWIVQAMADCDEEAKQRLDTLHFLVVPVTVTGTVLPGWSPSPISAIGNSAVLLNSSDTLIGLRNRALALYLKPLTFLVSDPTTDTIYKWKPATGVAALKRRGVDLESLKLGFEIPDLAKDIEWGPVINLKKGTCYWINPLVRTAARSG